MYGAGNKVGRITKATQTIIFSYRILQRDSTEAACLLELHSNIP